MEKAKRIKNDQARYAAWGKDRQDDHGSRRRHHVALAEQHHDVISDRIVPGKPLWNAGLLDLSATSIK